MSQDLVTKACGGCGLARYCSRACQQQQWRLHKAQCREWRAAKPSAEQGQGTQSQGRVGSR
jgi:hypothetical protein